MGDLKIYDFLSETKDRKMYFNAQTMRTKQGADFVSLLYAKQILMQKLINNDIQFLGRAEGSFQEVSIDEKIFCHLQQHLRHENNINFEPRIFNNYSSSPNGL